jgi:hypothetical protein
MTFKAGRTCGNMLLIWQFIAYSAILCQLLIIPVITNFKQRTLCYNKATYSTEQNPSETVKVRKPFMEPEYSLTFRSQPTTTQP